MFNHKVNSGDALFMTRAILGIYGLNEESNSFQTQNKNNVEETKEYN